MNKKLSLTSKALTILLSVVLCLACACAVNTFAVAHADTTADSSSKVLYYVDAGNLSTTEDGNGALAARNTTGYPSKIATGYMTENGLQFGTVTDGTISGLYNSVTDQALGADAVTGKTWGYDKTTYSWYVEHPGYFMYRVYQTSSTAYGYENGRSIEAVSEGPLTYKFEVDDNTTELKVEFGTRLPSDWSTKYYSVKINNGSDISVIASGDQDRSYSYTTTDGVSSANAIKGVLDETDGKYYVTLAFGNATEADGEVNWIMVSKADTYSVDQKFLAKDATTISVLSTDGSTAAATLTDDSKTAMAAAKNFATINVTATIGETSVSGSVTLLPNGTKYFVNFGGSGTEAQNIEYSSEKGYGRTGDDGTPSYTGANYDASMMYGKNLQYRFDVGSGSYAVVVGTYEYWYSRTMTVNINNVAQQSLTSVMNTATSGTYYVDLASDGAIELEVACGNDSYIVTYVLVYEVNKISYDTGNEETVSPIYFEKGSSVKLADIPTSLCYNYDGWYTGKDDGEKITDGTMLSASQTIYAHWSYIDYTITFVNYDGTELSSAEYHYGDAVTAPTATPTKPSDNTYNYTFNGWDSEVVACAGNATYTATFSETYIDYEIKFVNYDNSVIETKSYHYGETVTAPTATPTKPSDNTYKYTFNGWDKTVTAVSGDATYTATYAQDYIDYTIKFVNYDNSVIETKTYHYGETVTEPTEIPTRDADNTYTYTFKSWDKEITTVSGDATYTATYNEEYIDYTIKFVNYDNSVIETKTYHYGETVTAPTATPTKPSDNTYTYTFNGWTPEVVACAGNATYTAQFTETYIDYTVTFVNYDGTKLSSAEYHYGATVTEPDVPTKPSDNTYTYTFKSWDKEVTTVTGDATYTATYNEAYIDYTITFKNYNGDVIETKTYHYGETVTAPTATPTRDTDNTYTYTFKSWDKEITTVSGDATYTATYNEEYIDYTITFKNYNGDVIETKSYHYGETVTAPTATPTKPSDNTYTYTFNGWTPEVVACAGNATYTAQFTETYIDYTVTFVNYDGSTLSSGKYNYGATVTEPDVPTKPSDTTYKYTFNGWDKTVTAVSGDATYTATYAQDYIDYTIKFVNYDNSVIETKTYHYGETVTEPTEIPTRDADNTYTYTFKSWDKEIATVTGDATYTATYNEEYINYTIKFVNYDNSVIETKSYHYGETVTAPTATPTKPSDETYTYTFNGWTPEVVACAGNATYTATFSETYIDYTVTFVNYDGSTLSSGKYHYGATVTEPDVPTKPSDNTYKYTFNGWDKTVTAVSGDATYTATYKQDYINYTVTFKNYNGDTIETKTYHYGETVTAPTATPTRDADNTYTYTFKSWDKEIATVSGDATYTATYNEAYIDYTITFKNYNGDVIETKSYHYGETVTTPTATPTKPSDNTYTYTFNGWDKEIATVSGDATYTATYNEAYIDYTITFKNYNGDVIETKSYHYGETVTEPATTPTKPSDNTYKYTFNGWDKEITTVSGDATYTATYAQDYIDYTIKFVNYDNSVIETKSYHYGETVTAPTATPTRDADNTYTYTFKSWDKTVTTVAGDTTYKATYTPTYIEYTVKFVNYDNSVIETKTYHYGETVTTPTATPTKPSDSTYTYTFKSWDKEVTTVTSDATYTATYTQAYSDEYKSAQLLAELSTVIDDITTVDLSTYATIVDIQKRASGLTEADKAQLDTKLQPLIKQYTDYVKSINAEYAVAEEIESKYFVVVLDAINYLTVLAYAALKGKRWFL